MIGKFQKGGKQNTKQDAVMLFVQELAKTLQADPQQFVLVALLNPDALQAAVEAYQLTQDIGLAAQAFKQIVQQKTQAARHGTKLQYLKSLKHQCSEDEEVVYYKQGGSVNCGCVKKGLSGTEMPKNNPVKKFKERNQQQPKEQTYDLKTGKMRAATKEEIELRKKNRQDAAKGKGEGTPQRKKGGNIEKDCGGSAVARFKAKCGAKVKKHELGGSLNRIPFYLGGTSKGGIEKTSSIPNRPSFILPVKVKPVDWYGSVSAKSATFNTEGDGTPTYYESFGRRSRIGDRFNRHISRKHSGEGESDTIYEYFPKYGRSIIASSRNKDDSTNYKLLKEQFDKIVSKPLDIHYFDLPKVKF